MVQFFYYSSTGLNDTASIMEVDNAIHFLLHFKEDGYTITRMLINDTEVDAYEIIKSIK